MSKCDLCKKKISSNSTLHMRILEGEELSICDLCEKTLSQIDCAPIRKNTDKKTFKCEICKKAFSQQSSLKKHMSLTVHMRIHTG